ncbi:ATP-binding cassette sub-family A member 3 [Trichinella murrelli]|uniref:ATP-binding cassette sub-family A member 3 n=1 Tax=Trichinella murrelli TaxID=144512 RepID=A0A0V0TQG1_9BILA|nr:ATP-binding cassette sub-family A member 3 [Trichinella murrelli]
MKYRTLSQLKLLIWKNMLLQKRSLMWTLLELGIPMLFVVILLVLRQQVDSASRPAVEYADFSITATVDDFYEPVDGEPIHSVCFSPVQLYFTPKNNLTIQIMNIVNSRLRLLSKAYENEHTMVEDIMKELNQLDLCGCSAYGAVVFEEGFLNEAGLGEELKYKIRLSNTPRNSQSRRGTWNIGQASLFNVGHGWKTNALYAFPPQNGPRQSNSTDGGKPGYWREGFLILQHAIDKAIIRMLASNVTDVDKFHVHLKRFVYPPYVDNPFITVIQQHLPVIVLLSFAFSVVYISRTVVMDKELRVKEYMRVMGLKFWVHSAAHFICNFLKLAFISIMLTLFLCISINDKKILVKSDPSAVLFFFLIYSATSVCYCFVVGSFFKNEVQVRIGFIYSFVFVCHRRFTGNVVAGCTGLVWCSLYWPYFFIQPRYASVLRSTKLLTCLLVNSAMSYGIQLIGILEGQNVGLQWYNLFHRGTMYNNLSMIEVIGMLLVDAVLCLSIAWYVEAAKPRYNSIRQFISSKFCHKLFGSRRRKDSIGQVSSESSASNSAVGHFEDCDNPARVTVSIRKLYKIYENQSSGRKTAVEDLTLDLYYGQITALLGHNGAGKSTTISILTGVLAPSCGSVTINGMDMRKHFDKIQTTLGYCPQYNPLFACMTVYEHLKFYCKLKGRQLMPTEVDRLLHLLNLESKRHSLADHLSGGMKRKLCVAIALIGGSEVVLLDEPTTGMDPRARHDAWQLLLEEKQYRTMLLTTHFMEEADLLGDRIAVLSNGTLQCCGTSFFLKRQFGDGYRLKVIFKYAGKEKAEQLLKLIEEYIPGAQLSNCIGTEAIYTVPLIKGPKLHALFASIEQKLDQYDVESFGLSIVTMEEVFLRVSPKEPAVDNGQAHLSALADELDHKLETLNRRSRLNKGFKLARQQFWALVVKRTLDAVRNGRLLLVQWGVPVLFVAVALAINRCLPDERHSPALPLTVETYGPTRIGVYSDARLDGLLADQYRLQFSTEQTVEVVDDGNFTRFVLERIELSDQALFDRRYVVGASFEAGSNGTVHLTGHFNNQPLHAVAVSLNALDNALLRYADDHTGEGHWRSLTTVNEPLPATEFDRLVNWFEVGVTEFNLAFNLVFGFSLSTGTFVLFSITERLSGAKHLQQLCHVEPALFWVANFVCDFVVYLFTVFSVLLVFVAFDVDVLIDGWRCLHTLLLFVLYGWATIPFMYVASFFFDSATAGYVKMTVFNLLSGNGLLTLVVITVLLLLNMTDLHETLTWVFMALFPNFCLGQALSTYYFNYFVFSSCEPLMPFCEFTPDAFCCGQDTFTGDQLRWKRPGIGRFLFFLFLHGTLSVLLLLLWIDTRRPRDRDHWSRSVGQLLLGIRRRLFECTRHGGGASQQRLTDRENHDSETVRTETCCGEPLLRVERLRKEYGSGDRRLVAVDGVSFQVLGGECFGLLGCNGAGKTSTFRMLSGEQAIDAGDAFVHHTSLRLRWNEAKSMIGYCPQFDALLDNLTVAETLTLFARLHGILAGDLGDVIDSAADSVGLSAFKRQRVECLSGGNKRKLSLAIALINCPPVLLLDEPTSGVDPASRRTIWKILESARRAGVSIVLTSHRYTFADRIPVQMSYLVVHISNMEECEALCSRLAIMAGGEIKCTGSPQQLKSKYGKGYLLIVRVKSEQLIVPFVRMLEQSFPGLSVETLETMIEPCGIVDYMLSQPSLEQIFLTCVSL